MTDRLPLSAPLSFPLVTFTSEADNEAERRIPHRTARYGASQGGSLANFDGDVVQLSRWVPEQGIAVREVKRLAGTQTNWNGMQRWGHIYFEPSPDDSRPRPPQSAMIVRATARGRDGQEVWRALIPEIETRWRERFGAAAIEEVRRLLVAIASELDPNLPDCLPILKYGLFSEGPKPGKGAPGRMDLESLPLPALLARLLLAFALEYELESAVSLAIAANVLRVIEDEGTRERDLPALSGVSKEATAMALSYLTKRGYAVVEPEAGGAKERGSA